MFLGRHEVEPRYGVGTSYLTGKVVEFGSETVEMVNGLLMFLNGRSVFFFQESVWYYRGAQRDNAMVIVASRWQDCRFL